MPRAILVQRTTITSACQQAGVLPAGNAGQVATMAILIDHYQASKYIIN